MSECSRLNEQAVRYEIVLTVDVQSGPEEDKYIGPDREGLAEWPVVLVGENQGDLDQTGLKELQTCTLPAPARTGPVGMRHRPFAAQII